jgi:hypothetical protein
MVGWLVGWLAAVVGSILGWMDGWMVFGYIFPTYDKTAHTRRMVVFFICKIKKVLVFFGDNPFLFQVS